MRRFVTVTGPDETEPFASINTTPLIDVMLVLLIMIILTIPAALTKAPVNLPQSGPAAAAVVHRLAIGRDGAVTLDGAAFDQRALAARLRTIATVGDSLEVQTDPAARYDDFARTLGAVKRAGIDRLGFGAVRTREF